MDDKTHKSIQELVPVMGAGKGTWYLEEDVVSTGFLYLRPMVKNSPKVI